MVHFVGPYNLRAVVQFSCAGAVQRFSDRLATYINKHKVQTASEAAVLANEYVLTLKGHFGEPRLRSDRRRESFGTKFFPTGPDLVSRVDCGSHVKSDHGKICNYCRGNGH